MKVFALLLLLLLLSLPLQAQVSTYELSWNSVSVSPATSVVGYCSINDAVYFPALTVPTLQNTAGVIVNLNPGDKIACYAVTTDGVNLSPASNTAVAYEPMQISAQLCVAAGAGTWKTPPGHSPVWIWSDQILNLSRAWEMVDMWPGDFFNLTPARPCETETMMTVRQDSYHYLVGRDGKRGLAVCTLQ